MQKEMNMKVQALRQDGDGNSEESKNTKTRNKRNKRNFTTKSKNEPNWEPTKKQLYNHDNGIR